MRGGFIRKLKYYSIVIHVLDLMPVKPHGVLDRVLERWLRFAVGHHIEPVIVPAVFGDSLFVRCEADPSRCIADALYLDEVKFS